MSETMDTFETMREQLSNNLKLLSTQEFIRRRKEDVEIKPDTFRKFSPKAFQLITYHLFNKLNAEECGKRFIGCFPVKDRKQEGEFRQITSKWFKEIIAEKRDHHLPRVVPIYFQHFTPEPVLCHLYLEFTNYLLIKEIKKMSSGAQHLSAMNDTNVEEVIEKEFNEYQTTRAHIKEETEEFTQNMVYFVETFSKIKDSVNQLKEKENKLFDDNRNKYQLSSDSDVKEFLENHCKSLQKSVAKQKSILVDMNELVAKNWNNYLVAFEPQTDSSSDLTIDLNQWFGRNKFRSFSASAQEFMRRVKECDSALKNVSENTLNKLSKISTQYSTHLEDYKKHLKEMIFDMKIMLDQLQQLSKTKRVELLATPEIIERRKWFAERIPNLLNLKFKLEPKPAVKDRTKEPVVEPLPTILQESNGKDMDSPPVFFGRPSLCDYSFHVMDISTCHYVPPSGCPISMNDSHLFSPVESRTHSVFDSNSPKL